MMRAIQYLIVCLLGMTTVTSAQTSARFADSIREAYDMPELSYAVVSADSVYELHTSGVRKAGTEWTATLNDRFRIGSNTKAITGYIAAMLVKEGKIRWDTKFFDLFPEMKAGSRKNYHDLTLLQLLTFRTHLFAWTYTNEVPTKGQFHGTESEQRYQFAAWFFKEKPVRMKDTICFSNLGYVAAGLMLEKMSGKSYQQLVDELGSSIGADLAFGQPNAKDTLQTWGHNADMVPEAPADGYKLSWLQAAGNITATLPDYIKFIQLQLWGLQGRSAVLSKKESLFLFDGLPVFSVGWFHGEDDRKRKFFYNTGNPGSFLTMVQAYPAENKAFILFTNIQSDKAEEGLNLLLGELKRHYTL